MGWLFKDRPVDDPVDYLRKHFTGTYERGSHEVLDAARVGNTVYMALKVTNFETGASYTTALVILIRNSQKEGFGYKDMDESMGPYECDCPARIMRLLSPVDELRTPCHAADWRARVAARRTQKAEQATRLKALRPGAILALPEPVTFKGGISARMFRVVAVRARSHTLEPLDRPGFWCRLRRDAFARATILPLAATAIEGG